MALVRALFFSGLMLAPTAAASAEACSTAVPFGIATKAAPRGNSAAKLLPPKVGRFVREPVAPSANIPSDEDFNTTYRAGSASVFIGLSRPGSDADLKEAIRTSRTDAVSDRSIDRTGEKICLAAAPYYYHIPDFIAWTRGPYFVYADASSPAVLAEFMRDFPY